VSGTPGGAVFGPLLALLLFCYLVARFILLMTAWAATARGNELPAVNAAPAPPPVHPEPPARTAEPVTAPVPEARPRSTGSLVAALSAGMLLGAWLRGGRHEQRR
jgi:membrane protein